MRKKKNNKNKKNVDSDFNPVRKMVLKVRHFRVISSIRKKRTGCYVLIYILIFCVLFFRDKNYFVLVNGNSRVYPLSEKEKVIFNLKCMYGN